MHLKIWLATLGSIFLITSASASAQDKPGPAGKAEPVRVMVLGVYHFANPGQDLNNTQADDVLTVERQRELEILGEALAGFEPTVVAVEAQAEPPYVDEGYDAFSPADLTRDRNETVQIGYRVAKLAGLQHVYAIDEQPGQGEPDYFPYKDVAAFAEREGRSEELAHMWDFSDLVSQVETLQAKASIPEVLKFHNSGRMPDEAYWNVIGMGEGEDQPGAELAAYWFMRNAKIFNKLQQVSEPGDKVLLVFGAGHRDWLSKLVERTDGYELVDPLPYLDQALETLSREAG